MNRRENYTRSSVIFTFLRSQIKIINVGRHINMRGKGREIDTSFFALKPVQKNQSGDVRFNTQTTLFILATQNVLVNLRS